MSRNFRSLTPSVLRTLAKQVSCSGPVHVEGLPVSLPSAAYLRAFADGIEYAVGSRRSQPRGLRRSGT